MKHEAILSIILGSEFIVGSIFLGLYESYKNIVFLILMVIFVCLCFLSTICVGATIERKEYYESKRVGEELPRETIKVENQDKIRE